jgi:hypothetical protein
MLHRPWGPALVSWVREPLLLLRAIALVDGCQDALELSGDLADNLDMSAADDRYNRIEKRARPTQCSTHRFIRTRSVCWTPSSPESG